MKKLFILTLTLLLCFTSVVSVSYAETPYPAWDTVLESYGQATGVGYVITRNFGNDYCSLHVFSDNNSEIANNGAYFELTMVNDINYKISLRDTSGTTYKFKHHVYSLPPGETSWQLYRQSTADKDVTVQVTTTDFLESSHNIYNPDGTIFFQPPPVGLEAIIQEEVKRASQEITQTMMILTVCGVGLIALLILLVVFGKVLRIFQVQ